MGTTRQPAARYSTREIAARLFMSELRTRHFLFAAGVPYTRAGNILLWDAAGVERLLIATTRESPVHGGDKHLQ